MISKQMVLNYMLPVTVTANDHSVPQPALWNPSNNSYEIQSPFYVNFGSNIYKLKVSPFLFLSLFLMDS